MKKGFTLIELLAVIAILALVAGVAVPQAFNYSKNIKKDMYCEKVKMILNEAERWGNEHSGSLKESCYIERSVGQLINDGFLKKESDTVGKYIVNPYNDEGMDNTKIRIYMHYKNAVAYYAETNSELLDYCRDDNVPLSVGKC